MPVNNTNNKTPDEHINGLCIKSNSSTSLDKNCVVLWQYQHHRTIIVSCMLYVNVHCMLMCVFQLYILTPMTKGTVSIISNINAI